MSLLTETQRAEFRASWPEWSFDGEEIRKTFVFDDFLAAIAFVTRVAVLAEKADHHPDIDIRWNKVTLNLTTHDAGGLTTKDVDLATAIEA